MATSTIEARRRRIVDRGEDRLSLLTGRIKTLNSSTPSPNPKPEEPQLQSEHTRTISSPPILSRRDNIQSRSGLTIVDPSDDVNDNVIHSIREPKPSMDDINDNGICSSPEPKPSMVNETSSSTSTRYVDPVEHQLHTSEGNVGEIRSPALGISNEKQPKLVASIVVEESSQSTQSDATPPSHAEPRSHHPTLFSPKQISSAIAASENFRVLCSITITLLVRVSHVSLPILSSCEIVKNFIMSWPLYLGMLADFTIVTALLLFAKRGGPVKAVEKANSRGMDVGKALETGILVYMSLREVFMDCSVYAVVLISGLSLLQTFRS